MDSIGMKFARIPAGTFLMGSPPEEKGRSKDEEQHEVEITRPFSLSVYPVTQGQWRAVLGNNPSYFCALGGGQENVQGMNTEDFPALSRAHSRKQAESMGITENAPSVIVSQFSISAALAAS